jgi:hypothetical protein
MITVPRTLKTKPKKVSNQESDIQWLHHRQVFLRLELERNSGPVAASYKPPGVLAEAAHKTGRAKTDFELRQIGREEYERLSKFL